MTAFAGRERVLIDWEDLYQTPLALGGAVGGNDDISDYVSQIDYGYGMGVFNDPRGFGLNLLNGSIRLNADLEGIPEYQLGAPHIFRHIIDGHIIMEGVAQPVRDRAFQLVSKNSGVANDDVQLAYTEEATDFKLWFDAHQSIAAQAGPVGYFNGYTTRGALEIAVSYGAFLNAMATFAGGYAFEDRFCRMNFMAARAGRLLNWNEWIDEVSQDLFYLDISAKEGVVRNEAQTEILRPTSIERETIRGYTFTLAANSARTLYTQSPEGKVSGAWSVVVTSPDPRPATLSTQITEQDGRGMAFTVFNADDEPADVQLSVFATTYNTRLQENFANINVASSILYGRQPLEDFPNWGADNQPISEELGRLRNPLNVATIRLPIRDSDEFGNPLSYLLYDTGTLLRVREEGRVIDMMIGRKKVISGDILELVWEMVELPTGVAAYDRGWLMDNDDYILGVNTYLRDRSRAETHSLTLAGCYLELEGQQISFAPLNLLTMNGRYLTINGNYLNLRIG